LKFNKKRKHNQIALEKWQAYVMYVPHQLTLEINRKTKTYLKVFTLSLSLQNTPQELEMRIVEEAAIVDSSSFVLRFIKWRAVVLLPLINPRV